MFQINLFSFLRLNFKWMSYLMVTSPLRFFSFFYVFLFQFSNLEFCRHFHVTWFIKQVAKSCAQYFSLFEIASFVLVCPLFTSNIAYFCSLSLSLMSCRDLYVFLVVQKTTYWNLSNVIFFYIIISFLLYSLDLFLFCFLNLFSWMVCSLLLPCILFW